MGMEQLPKASQKPLVHMASRLQPLPVPRVGTHIMELQ